MIKANLLSIGGSGMYHSVEIYPPGTVPAGVVVIHKNPFIWKCKDGVLSTDVETVTVIQLSTCKNVPKGARKKKICRLTVGYAVTYENCYIVTNPVEAFGVPPLLGDKMIGFVNNDGTFLTTKPMIHLMLCRTHH